MKEKLVNIGRKIYLYLLVADIFIVDIPLVALSCACGWLGLNRIGGFLYRLALRDGLNVLRRTDELVDTELSEMDVVDPDTEEHVKSFKEDVAKVSLLAELFIDRI